MIPAGFNDLLLPEERIYSLTPEAASLVGMDHTLG